jgi:hypothetical protein
MDRRNMVRGALAAFWATSAQDGSASQAKPPLEADRVEDARDDGSDAQTLIVIRHAEKPNVQQRVLGVTLQGGIDRHSLSLRGWQRAGALAVLFGPEGGRSDYPTPAFVFAGNPNAIPNNKSLMVHISKRPHQTIVPLCDRLKMQPFISFGVGDEVAMINMAQEKRGVVLICWDHTRIVEALLPEIAKGQSIPSLPMKWANSRYDVMLRFDRPQKGAPWTYRQLFPKLLAGDSSRPL